MIARSRIIVVSVVVLLLAGAGWYWWRTRRIEWYGGAQPFMRTLRDLHDKTSAELAKAQKLPEDYEYMERLSQDAKDLIAVFARWKDPRRNDPRFGALAVELQRQATLLENNWDHGSRDQALKSFNALTTACNTCHAQIAEGKPPKINPVSESKGARQRGEPSAP